MKNWLIRKDPDAEKDWRQEEKGTTENEIVGWHHWLDGHEFEQALGVSDEQESLVCYNPRGHKESDMTEQLNWTALPSRNSNSTSSVELPSGEDEAWNAGQVQLTIMWKKKAGFLEEVVFELEPER